MEQYIKGGREGEGLEEVEEERGLLKCSVCEGYFSQMIYLSHVNRNEALDKCP